MPDIIGWITAELEKIKLLLLTAVAVVSTFYVLGNKAIQLFPTLLGWRDKFREQIQAVRNSPPTKMPSSPVGPASFPGPNAIARTGRDLVGLLFGVKQTVGRDLVLEAWGAVKQAVYDGCIAKRVTMTPTLGVAGAVDRLGVDDDLRRLVVLVDRLGAEVAKNGRQQPSEDDARAYQSLAHSAADWLARSVLVPRNGPPPQPEPQRRATVVGGSFLPPSPGNPSAVLIAIGGPLKGQQYPVDKSDYRLGRSASNDLRAAADDSVSSEHARLRYENGGLFLDDQDSRNGTFLNDQRVTRTPVMVRPGDRIRLGESVFEVVGASATARAR